MLLGKLGSFKIEVANSIAHTISQEWAKKSRIQNNPAYFATSKWEESINFSGTVVLENNNYLDELKQMVKDAKPVTLVIANVVYAMVVVESINFTKSNFLSNGAHISEEFSVSIKRYFP